jgi:hypothetical protein
MKIDGRTVSHEASEATRLMAVRRVKEGESLSAVIKSYGLSRTTICKWFHTVDSHGESVATVETGDQLSASKALAFCSRGLHSVIEPFFSILAVGGQVPTPKVERTVRYHFLLKYPSWAALRICPGALPGPVRRLGAPQVTSRGGQPNLGNN